MRYIASDTPFSAPRAVKALVIANGCAWLFLVLILQRHFLGGPFVFQHLGLSPASLLELKLWQPFTYMFLHGSGLFHILLNMFVLWMFGSELERLWGARVFLACYLWSGAFAALIYSAACFIYVFVLGGSRPEILSMPVVGASGAVFGLLTVYGFVYSERTVLFMAIFPMKAKHFAFFIAGIELVTLLETGFGGPVANLAHLGGLVAGFLFLYWRKYLQRIRLSSLFQKNGGRGGGFFGGRRRPRLRVFHRRRLERPAAGPGPCGVKGFFAGEIFAGTK